MFLSADGLAAQGLYDAGAAYISPVWFEQLAVSTDSDGVGSQQSIQQVEWKNETVEVYADE